MQPDGEGADVFAQCFALRWFLLLVSALIYLSYVYLISRCDSAPASYTCFLDALVLHFFEWAADAGSPSAVVWDLHDIA